MNDRSSPDTERSAFIKAYPHLDLTEVPDAWGRPMFKHTHVQALWDGWFARATQCSADIEQAGAWINSAYDELCVRFSGVHSDDAMDSVLLRLHAALKKLGIDPTAPYIATPLPDAAQSSWRPIETAPKDGTRVLVYLKDPLPVKDRQDLDHWHGIPFIARHNGVCEDGFDIGWQFAAPVGCGGFPDAWMAGWQPIPPLSSTHSNTAAEMHASGRTKAGNDIGGI